MSTERSIPTTDSSEDGDRKSQANDGGLSVAQAFGFAWEMGYTLALPLVLLALGGRLLDKWLQTSPIFLLIGILLSIGISSILVAYKAMDIIARVSPKDKSADKNGAEDKN